MGRSSVSRVLWVFCALLAIAGGASTDIASRGTALLPLDPLERATDSRLAPDAVPGHNAAGLPERLGAIIRYVPGQLRLEGDAPHADSTLAFDSRSSSLFRLEAVPLRASAAHYQSDRLKRSGAISSFGTSLPPPLGA